MGDIKLLPCPFCGGEARLNDLTPFFWTVNCTGCETEGAPFPSSDESVSAWNTRPALLARQEWGDAILQRISNPHRWSPEMSKAWHNNIPDMTRAFSALIEAARSGGGG